ncbi:MAG TPA: hypothetical protein VJ972_06000, partial [Anaerolineales bacterium]|nr:hypothetical protein [Anaerolineales bacterium]
TQKLDMYPTLNVDNVSSATSALFNVGASEQVAFDIARNAATLISPDPQELNTLLPAPPNSSDRIVFLTDVSQYSQCTECPIYDSLAVDSFERTVLRLFGPDGSGQVFRNRVSSFSLNELLLLLDDTTETNIESALSNSSWIVISLADVGDDQINVLRLFFSERPNLIRNRNVILFSFTAPYYLDATDISKLTAYYALYSKQPAFVDAAARILFQQATLQGASPVSVPAVGYDLIQQTSPDPDQIIPLQLDQEDPNATETVEAVTPGATEVPSYKIGDSISVRAGPVFDHNQHLVPDGTVVRFTMTTRDEGGGILQQVDVTTQDGVARASFVIDKPGNVEVRAVSEPAVISDFLQFDATNEGVAVTVVPVITQTPEPPTPVPATATPVNNFISPEGYPRSGIWFLVLLGILGSAVLTYWAVSRVTEPRWGVRFALSVLIGGFGAYNYLALGFPRALEWISSDSGGSFGVLLFTLAGEALGIILAWLWFRWFSGSGLQSD